MFDSIQGLGAVLDNFEGRPPQVHLADGELVFQLRTAEGDLREEGSPAHDALLAATRRVFAEPFFKEGWSVVGGGATVTAHFSGTAADGSRSDTFVIARGAGGGKVTRIAMLCVGALEARPARELVL
jgi:hypothetical protein